MCACMHPCSACVCEYRLDRRLAPQFWRPIYIATPLYRNIYIYIYILLFLLLFFLFFFTFMKIYIYIYIYIYNIYFFLYRTQTTPNCPRLPQTTPNYPTLPVPKHNYITVTGKSHKSSKSRFSLLYNSLALYCHSLTDNCSIKFEYA